MGLLNLPTELRIHIYSFLSDFSARRIEAVGTQVRITPPICRTSRQLRKEALPLYATACFTIDLDDCHHGVEDLLGLWLDALGVEALAQVQTLQLSRHWRITQPTRWQSHVGLYLRLHSRKGDWQCTAGTYPTVNDVRGMRSESVSLLLGLIRRKLKGPSGLKRSDIDFCATAIEIVASHPISALDTDQSEDGNRRRSVAWEQMEHRLVSLESADGAEHPARPSFTAR